MQQKNCPICGRRLDMNTGLCPACNSYSYATTQQGNQQVAAKKNKIKTIVIAAVAGFLALVLLAVVLCVVFTLHKQDDIVYSSPLLGTYADYLNNDLLPELGKYDAEHPEKNTPGVCSALCSDLDLDSKDEFIVAYTVKNTGTYTVNVSCYEFNDKTTSESVEEVGTVELNPDDLPGTQTESILYSVEYQGKKYIIYEHMNYPQSYSYDAHVYTLNDGKFEEVSNLYIPAISDKGAMLIYSTKPPGLISIDNSDFVYDATESGSLIKENFVDNGGKILYFNGGAESKYEYKTYYKSSKEAIKEFFDCFGVNKNKDVEFSDGYEGKNIYISRPNDVEFINTYAFYMQSDDDGNEREIFEFDDYTKWEIAFNGYDSVTETETGLSETEIKEKAEAEIENIAQFECHDYDKNGTFEAFVVSAKEDADGFVETPWYVYYIDSSGEVRQMDSFSDLSYYFDDSTKYLETYDSHGFFCYNKGGYGSGWQTDIYSVKDGEPKKLNSEGIQGFSKKDDGTFYTTQNEFADGGGHSYPEYELIYDSEECEFSIGSKLS